MGEVMKPHSVTWGDRTEGHIAEIGEAVLDAMPTAVPLERPSVSQMVRLGLEMLRNALCPVGSTGQMVRQDASPAQELWAVRPYQGVVGNDDQIRRFGKSSAADAGSKVTTLTSSAAPTADATPEPGPVTNLTDPPGSTNRRPGRPLFSRRPRNLTINPGVGLAGREAWFHQMQRSSWCTSGVNLA